MKILIKTWLFSLFLLLLGCEEDINKNVQGLWTIEKMTCMDQSCLESYLVNILDIENGRILLPVKKRYDNDTAYWTIHKENTGYVMKIKSDDPVFSRVFTMNYERKANSNPILILKSDSVVISCRKFPEVR